jgi:hypothetical protein
MKKRLVRQLALWWIGRACAECGGYLRDCRTSVSRGGVVEWRAKFVHGRKCVECGSYRAASFG